MRVYSFDLDGRLLLLQTDEFTAFLIDHGEVNMTDVLFTARIIDPNNLFDYDKDDTLLCATI